MKHLETISRKVEFAARVLFIIGAIALCALFLLMFGDIVGRLFNAPIKGTVEVGEYLLVALVFLSLAFAQLKGAHVRAEILVERFPWKLRTIVNILVLSLATVFFAVMARQIAGRAYLDWVAKSVLSLTEVHLPIWWTSFLGAVGCAMLVISLVLQVVNDISKLIKG